MIVEERTLDLNKQNERTGTIKPIYLRRGEKNETQIKINLTDDGLPYTPSGLTAKFCAFLANRDYVKNTANTTLSGSTVTYTVQSDLTSYEGEVCVAYVELSASSKVITTERVPIYILLDVDLSDSQAKDYQNRVDHLIDQLNTAISKANTATSNANTATDKANTATTNANAATSAANAAANRANAIAESMEGDIKDLWAHDKAHETDLAILAKNNCTSGMLINGIWYTNGLEIENSAASVEDATISGSQWILPVKHCVADEALEIANEATTVNAEQNTRLNTLEKWKPTVDTEITDEKADRKKLWAAINTLAMNLDSYPFLIDTTYYTRGSSVSSGIVTIPSSTWSGEQLVVDKM